jgi:HPt (histidine-containing phosphotransfer) domain-containing protein
MNRANFTTFDRAVARPASSMSEKPSHSAHPTGSSVDGSGGVFDLDVTLTRLGGNLQLFEKLVHFYFDDAPQLVEKLRHAAVHGDVALVERAAHTLKSLAANFEALTAARAALRVEEFAQARNLGSAIECIPELEKQLHRLDQALARYTDDSTG